MPCARNRVPCRNGRVHSTRRPPRAQAVCCDEYAVPFDSFAFDGSVGRCSIHSRSATRTGVRPRCVRRAVPLLAAQRRGAHRRVLASAQRCSPVSLCSKHAHLRTDLGALTLDRHCVCAAVCAAACAKADSQRGGYLCAATTACSMVGADLTAPLGLRSSARGRLATV